LQYDFSSVGKSAIALKVGEAGFDDIINEGTVKWAVTTNLELLVIPKFLDVNNEIYHKRKGVKQNDNYPINNNCNNIPL
jgi:hypothetical protein